MILLLIYVFIKIFWELPELQTSTDLNETIAF
jgi:hypothetical protein